MRDWDDPATATVWPDFRRVLAAVRKTGSLPDDYQSHDHLNQLAGVGVDPEVKARWRARLQAVDVTWVLVDGFVLYWDEVSRARAKQAQMVGHIEQPRPTNYAASPSGPFEATARREAGVCNAE